MVRPGKTTPALSQRLVLNTGLNIADQANQLQPVQTLISLAQFDPIIAQLPQEIPGLANLLISGQSALDDAANLEQLISAHGDRADLTNAAQRDDVAVLIYTSGTIGRPKGAGLSHGNLLANARSCLELIRGNMTVRRALDSHFAGKWLRRRGITASYGEYWQ